MARNNAKQAPSTSERVLSRIEIESGVNRLRARIEELDQLIKDKPEYDSAQVQKVQSKLTETILAIYGDQSRRIAEIPRLKYPNDYWNYCERPELQKDFIDNLPKALAWVESHIESLEESLHENLPRNIVEADLWSHIHPAIVSLCKRKFEDTHFADSVETAMKAVNQRVKVHFKNETGKEVDGTPLMQQAFSPNDPKIELADLNTISGKDEQLGYMNIYAGAMQGIRNPKAHANLEIDSKRAIHLLFLSSLLMYRLDDANVT
jgi:uncharacterized protein (TIGR02391 family)